MPKNQVDQNNIVHFLKTHCVCPIQIKFLRDSNIDILLGIVPISGTAISSSPLLYPDDPLLTEFNLDLQTSALKYAKIMLFGYSCTVFLKGLRKMHIMWKKNNSKIGA